MPAKMTRWTRLRLFAVVAIAAVVLAIVGLIVIPSGSDRLIAKARDVELGHSKADVLQVLGEPEIAYTIDLPGMTTTFHLYRPRPDLTDHAQQFLSRVVNRPPAAGTHEDFPVEVRFGQDERVNWCRRGTDVVDR